MVDLPLLPRVGTADMEGPERDSTSGIERAAPRRGEIRIMTY
jgi:hypothetical protein